MAEAGRVVAGSASGVRLRAPGEGTRPLSDRVKQSLFGMLTAAGVVGPDRAFLDLFAGSGAAGIEALSLGCRLAVFVEDDRRACAVIEQNVARTGLSGALIVNRDVLRFLAAGEADAGNRRRPFDAVLVDPPYASSLVEPALVALGEPGAGWLSPDSIVVAKHFWRDAGPAQAGALQRYRERRFGETMLSFYRLLDAENEP